ncbi:MAG: DUF3800 domain-containing protein [Mariprofundaceae bacterium]|nr:DUF3800 domain-containing protein [Mariprofundaceae bacterium]
MNAKEFSDYIVYVDESGDHGLQNIDPNYPIFVLAFCIFHKNYYCDGVNQFKKTLPFDIKFADKRMNSAGLQLADLLARPVGLHVLRPKQSNRAFDILKPKFYCEDSTADRQ